MAAKFHADRAAGVMSKAMCVHAQVDRPSCCMICLLILVSMHAHCACKREYCTDAVRKVE